MKRFSAVMESRMEETKTVVDELKAYMRKENLSLFFEETRCFELEFVLRELLNNAIEHGNKYDENKRVFLEVFFGEVEIIFRVEDEGKGFNIEEELEKVEKESIWRERRRGLITLRNMGYSIKMEDGCLEARKKCEKQKKKEEKDNE